MRIILIVHSVSWTGGGAFFHALHLGKRMVQNGHSVSILATSKSNRIRVSRKIIDGIDLIESVDLLWGDARNGWDMWNTLRRILLLSLKTSCYDIVHCLDCRPVVIFPGLYLKYFRKSKLVIEWLDWFGKEGTSTERGPLTRIFMGPVETFFEERFRRYADGTIGLGEPLTERARSMGINNNILTITHGCDATSINQLTVTAARQKTGFSTEGYLLGYTGRLRKDAAVLFIKTIQELRTTYGMDVKGIFIGNTSFDLDKYLNEKTSSFIIQTGWISYEMVNAYLCSCDLLLLPFKKSVARNKIWPSKINDYLCAGRPIVATDLEILQSLFNEDGPGILCDEHSSDFALACHGLLIDIDMRTEMGKRGRHLAISTYEWKGITSLVTQFYQSLIN